VYGRNVAGAERELMPTLNRPRVVAIEDPGSESIVWPDSDSRRCVGDRHRIISGRTDSSFFEELLHCHDARFHVQRVHESFRTAANRSRPSTTGRAPAP
jgi:hypothetical protein